MNLPRLREVTTLLLALGMAGVLVERSAGQVVSLPFQLTDVAGDPLAQDFCGVDFSFTDPDTFNALDAGGVSIADFDNDGLQDLFFPASTGASSKLYRNLGNMNFVDVAPASGVTDPASCSAAALFIDYDHDGDLDLFVVSHLGKPGFPLGPRFKLFRNRGAVANYAYTDVTSTAGFALGPTSKLTNWGLVSGICAGDFNHDGWVDLFAAWNATNVSTQDQWRLMRNAPNPTPGDPLDPNYTPRIFIDATPSSGIQGEFGGEPWQAMFWDVNRDGWPDLHIPHDYTTDLMFINNKNGTWTNVATSVGLNGNPVENRNEMGSALADPDNDLDEDLHMTNRDFLDRFYRNDSIGTVLSFTDAATLTGLNDSSFGWGTTFLDLDNDGDLDHMSVTSSVHDLSKKSSNPVQLNLFPQRLRDGLNVKWQTVTNLLPEFSLVNTTQGDFARGLAAGDLDGDGDMDCVVTRDFERARVMKNTLVSSNAWIEVDLVNSGGSLDNTGVRIYLRDDGVTQLREVFTGSSFLCQESPRLHFGLGKPSLPFGTADVSPGAMSGELLGSESVGSLPLQPARSADGTGINKQVDPLWVVVRWTDGSCQIVNEPASNSILTIVRSLVNDVGDLDADGHLTVLDQGLLLLATQNLAAYEALYPRSPAVVVGDVDNNGLLNGDDLTAWAALPPH